MKYVLKYGNTYTLGLKIQHLMFSFGGNFNKEACKAQW